MERFLIVNIKLILAFAFLTSCVDIRFEEPQPSGLSDLDSFPTEFVGKYLPIKKRSEKSKQLIEKQNKQNAKKKGSKPNIEINDTLTIKEHSFDTDLLTLSKDTIKEWKIRRYNDSCIVISLLKEDTVNNIKTWYVHPIVKRDSLLIIQSLQFPQSIEDSTLVELRNVTEANEMCHQVKKKKKKKKHPDEYYKSCYYLANPSFEEFELLINNQVFKETFIFKKVE